MSTNSKDTSPARPISQGDSGENSKISDSAKLLAAFQEDEKDYLEFQKKFEAEHEARKKGQK